MRAKSDKSASPAWFRARERALAELAGRQHGVVASWQLLEQGFSRDAINLRAQEGRLNRVHAGVYAVGHESVIRDGRWLAAVLAAGPEAALSHRDCAALWQVADLCIRGVVEVTVPGLGSRARPGVRIHRTRRLAPYERTLVNGIPVTSVERLMIDLAGTISPRHLRAAYLEAERKGLLDPGLLAELVRQSRGRRGLSHVRRLIAEDTSALARTRSPLEVMFFDFCRDHCLPEPLLNVWVGGYLVDAYWPDANLVVELDGYEYHRGRGSFERDRAKIGDLKLIGIELLPVTYRRLTREPAKIARILREATRPGPTEADLAH